MKKILLSIFMFLCLFERVDAKVYYTDYGEFSDYSLNEVLDTELKLVESVKMYKYYNEYEEGDYFLEKQNGYEIDLNKFKIVESDWLKEQPKELENRVIEERSYYNYYDIKDVRYIHLYKIIGNMGKMNVHEIEVFVNNKKIDYEAKCINCSNDFETLIKDSISKQYNNYINDDGHLIIDMNDYYNPDEIKIRVHLYNDSENPNTYVISLNNSESLERNYFEGKFINYYKSQNQSDIGIFIYNTSSFGLLNPEYDFIMKKDEYIDTVNYQRVEEVKEYKTIDKLFYNYKKLFKYSDYMIYKTDDFPYKTNDYKIFYRFKTRDKIEIKDDIVITKKNVNLLDYIDSTNQDIKVISNINYNKNGLYTVSYVLPFGNYRTTVLVNIDDNKEKNSEKNVIATSSEEANKNNYSVLQGSLVGISLVSIVFIIIRRMCLKKSIKKNV